MPHNKAAHYLRLQQEGQRATDQQSVDPDLRSELMSGRPIPQEAPQRRTAARPHDRNRKGPFLPGKNEDKRPKKIELLLHRQRPEVARESVLTVLRRRDEVSIKKETPPYLMSQKPRMKQQTNHRQHRKIQPGARHQPKKPPNIKRAQTPLVPQQTAGNQVSAQHKKNAHAVLTEVHPPVPPHMSEQARLQVGHDHQQDGNPSPSIESWYTPHRFPGPHCACGFSLLRSLTFCYHLRVQ